MGFFSYKCAKSNVSIPAFPHASLPLEASKVVMVTPKNRKIMGVYDGYGRIDGHDIFEEIVFDLYGKRDRELVFGPVKFLMFDGQVFGEVKMSMYDDPIKEEDIIALKYKEFTPLVVGSTLNEMVDNGIAVKSLYDSVERMIKIVRQDHYNNESYDQLPPSKRDETQGFFYDNSDAIKILKSLSIIAKKPSTKRKKNPVDGKIKIDPKMVKEKLDELFDDIGEDINTGEIEPSEGFKTYKNSFSFVVTKDEDGVFKLIYRHPKNFAFFVDENSDWDDFQIKVSNKLSEIAVLSGMSEDDYIDAWGDDLLYSVIYEHEGDQIRFEIRNAEEIQDKVNKGQFIE